MPVGPQPEETWGRVKITRPDGQVWKVEREPVKSWRDWNWCSECDGPTTKHGDLLHCPICGETRKLLS